MSKKQIVENYIRGIVEKELMGEVSKLKSVELPNSNLLLRGFGYDTNGNKIVKLEFFNGKKFTLQTNGNLPKTHTLYTKNLNDLDENSLLTIRDEVRNFILKYGSTQHKKNLQ